MLGPPHPSLPIPGPLSPHFLFLFSHPTPSIPLPPRVLSLPPLSGSIFFLRIFPLHLLSPIPFSPPAAQELVPRPIRTPRVSGTPIISPITRFASMPRHPHGIPRRITREYYEFIRFYYGLQYDDTGMIAPIVDSLERMTQRAHI